MLLNTSLNKRGMPIVETPEEAVSFFLDCALDALVLGQLGQRGILHHASVPAGQPAGG